jgi:hypothetical protein
MKKLLVFVFPFFLIVSSCQFYEENEIVEFEISMQEIAKEIYNDSNFKEFLNLSNLMYDNFLLSNDYKELSNTGVLEEVVLDLFVENLEIQLYNNYSSSIETIIRQMKSKYPSLEQMTQKDLNSLATSLSNRYSMEKQLNKNNFNARVLDECDDQFNEDFDRIHQEHDYGVIICLIVTLGTNGAGFVPCNAANKVKTSIAVGTAVDNYTLCKTS